MAAADRTREPGSDGTWHIVENWYWHECMGGGGPAKSAQVFRDKGAADKYLPYRMLQDDPHRGMALAQYPNIRVTPRRQRVVVVRSGAVVAGTPDDLNLIERYMSREDGERERQRVRASMMEARAQEKEATLKRRAMKAYKAKKSTDDGIGDMLAYADLQDKKKKAKKKKAKATATKGGGGAAANASTTTPATIHTPALKRQLSDHGKDLLNKALG